MNNPKVSIITPTFNRGHLIKDTIESVMCQTYPNIEYIVVDGKSTDNTLEILESFKNEGKLTYISQKDKGMYFAINDGLRMATGEIIAYLNSDDFYFPWTVQVAVDFLKRKNADMIYGDSLVLDCVNKKEYLNVYAAYQKYWLPTGGILCQPTVFLRRNVFEEIGGFNVDFKCLADCEYWLRVAVRSRFKIEKIDEFLAIEQNHDNTHREKLKNIIVEEKEELGRVFGGVYCKFKIIKVFLEMINYFSKEMKIWRFILINFFHEYFRFQSWQNFLSIYLIRFHPLHYILCKVFHDRSRFPRFSITRKKQAGYFHSN